MTEVAQQYETAPMDSQQQEGEEMEVCIVCCDEASFSAKFVPTSNMVSDYDSFRQ